ncbi:ABC transporter ATP-binding protein [Thermobifida cellulosilytica]|jgi:putative ABC transport system ATP-binding protein|uniref:ABC transporter ATP-binding protein n=1 Tax=Thermobifida cellulosilytica TaxID=144786 RepID=UPI000A01D4C2|nr:ABC transporter ATP-binding protein [Thermobifida cellulosilytica]
MEWTPPGTGHNRPGRTGRDGSPPVWTVGLTKTHGKGPAAVRALDGVTASFERGVFTAVMGPSGSGKSTFLHCLAGLESPDSGEVVVAGRDITRMSEKELTRLRSEAVGFVFQSFHLIPTLTVEENITIGQRLSGRPVDSSWRDELVAFLGLAERVRHRPSELSGGQQQRVAVARALIHRPVVVFADEPTGNLDSRSGQRVLDALRHAVDRNGQSVVMVTHDPVAAARADRVLFLRDGRLAGELVSPDASAVLERLKRLEQS